MYFLSKRKMKEEKKTAHNREDLESSVSGEERQTLGYHHGLTEREGPGEHVEEPWYQTTVDHHTRYQEPVWS